MGVGLRYFGGALAFGFAAVWVMASLAAALVCLLSAVLAYGVVWVAERMHAKRTRQGSGSGRAALASVGGRAQRRPWAHLRPGCGDVASRPRGRIRLASQR